MEPACLEPQRCIQPLSIRSARRVLGVVRCAAQQVGRVDDDLPQLAPAEQVGKRRERRRAAVRRRCLLRADLLRRGRLLQRGQEAADSVGLRSRSRFVSRRCSWQGD